MQIVILTQIFPQGNYLLNKYIAEKLARLISAKVTVIPQAAYANISIEEYAALIKSFQPDLIYYEMLEIKSFEAVALLDVPKILLHASRGVFDSHEKLLDYYKKYFDYIYTNSLYFYKECQKRSIPSEHFCYYPAPFEQESKHITSDKYEDDHLVFLGQGYQRLTDDIYDLERNLFFSNSQIYSNLSIYGSGWNNHVCWKGLLPPDDIPYLYSHANSVIAVIDHAQRNAGQINNRYSEAFECGAKVISPPYPIDWFGAEKFINFVNSPEDVVYHINPMSINTDALIDEKKFIQNQKEIFFQKFQKIINDLSK